MSRKGENIYRRKDGRWEGRYMKGRTLEGKLQYGYVYAKTYREVKAKMMTKATFADEKTTIVSKEEVDIFENIANEWINSIRQQVKLSTYNRYLNLLSLYILPHLGRRPLNEITHSLLEDYCNRLLGNGGKKEIGLSPKTVTDSLSVIRNVLNFAKAKGKIVSCDTSTIRIKKTVKAMRILSQTEQMQLCRYLSLNLTTYNVGILVSLFTGLRLGELCALQWEDFSFSEQTLHVNKTMQRVQDKSGYGSKTKIIVTSPKSPYAIRSIPIPMELMETIVSCQTASKGYFLSADGIGFVEPRTMQNHFKRTLNECGIADANFHALRHTFATRCIECGFDVKTLSEILGHASVNITMNRYVHPSMELKRENMKRLSVLLDVR